MVSTMPNLTSRSAAAMAVDDTYIFPHKTELFSDEVVMEDTESSSGGVESSSTSDEERDHEEDWAIFDKARQYLQPSFFFRWVISLYAQRKMAVFFLIHFTSTMVIWAHFAMIKLEQQKNGVPEGANRYWLKVLAPTLEFGSMHAILFQMSLIPITMCRFSIAALSDSVLNTIVPLNRTLGMHIHLGYVMISIVFFASIFFFIFFGLLCVEGEEDFCNKFTIEIMITGYCILASLLLIGVTSFFRHRIPYQVFYVIHHIVFAMYIVTIAHTLDIEQRSGRAERSQTFKWFSSTLLFYICDRVAMKLNHQYSSKLVGSSVVQGSQGSKLVILKVRRPVLFDFKPGQYASIRIGAIDRHWHPFSIASCPESSHLEFYIEVFEGKAWTNQLWKLLGGDYDGLEKASAVDLDVDIMGPYGTSLGKTQDFSHILAVGAGTGVVPILSLYQQHVQSLLRLNPQNFFAELKLSEQRARELEIAEAARKGTLAQKIASLFFCCRARANVSIEDRRGSLSTSIRTSIKRLDSMQVPRQIQTNMKEMKRAVSRATRSVYGTTFLSLLPVFGVTLFALVVSWSTLSIDLYPNMMNILKYLTIVFQAAFAIGAFFFWNASGLLPYVDVVFILISPFADWYWLKVCDEYGVLQPSDLVTYSLLIWYMIVRVWVKAVAPQHSTWYRATSQDHGATGVDKLNFVWLTRSASQVSEILPDILSLWDALVDKWGLQNARRVCNISVFVTDPDEDSCGLLHREFGSTEFFQNGGIQFQRADLMKVIERHTMELVNTRTSSRSLLAFCGSPGLAREIHYCKISNDMISAVTGNKHHQMEFVSESYGGVKASSNTDEKGIKDDRLQLLTNRTTVAYQFDTIDKDAIYLEDSTVSSSLSKRSRNITSASGTLWI